MTRYAAFLRGINPLNGKSADLTRSFVAAGFTEVRTVLSSGNVVFTARAAKDAALAERAEAALELTLGHSFPVIIRSLGALDAILAHDHYKPFRVSSDAKRVVTFLREAPTSKVKLPRELDGARVLCVRGTEAYSAYVPHPRGPVFMTLIEKTLGKDVTTRTWDSVTKVASAAAAAGTP